MCRDKTEKRLKCHDCGINHGQLHTEGCDWEICPICGGQFLSCDCDKEGLKDSKRIPYGTVREIAARIPYYDNQKTIDRAKKDLLIPIENGLW